MRLLEAKFPGWDEVRTQIDSCLVRPIDENGSLKFFVQTETQAAVKSRIAVEGEMEDEDSVTVHVLLHVIEGKVDELEIYKDDSSNLLTRPDPTKLRTFLPY